MKASRGLNRSDKRFNPNQPGKFSGQHRGKVLDRASLPEGIFIVEGIAALREYFLHKPESVQKVFIKERALRSLEKEIAELKIKFSVVKEGEDTGQESAPIWAHVKHGLQDWSEFLVELGNAASKSLDLVLVLDHISDPRNLGAIVRSAAFFGVQKIVVPERRQVLLTQAVVNTAQGGFALADLVVVVNVSRALETLKEKGFWVLGAAMGGEAVSSVRRRYDKQVLVLGSEDKGISQGVLSKCDVLVSIPGALNSLDSLNVSVAAGILMHELKIRP